MGNMSSKNTINDESYQGLKATSGAAHVNIRDSSGIEVTDFGAAQSLSGIILGTEAAKDTWPAATTVAHSFTPVDVTDYSTINLVCLMATGSVTLNVDVGWSVTGLAADIHTTDTAVLAGTGTGIGAVVTKKDNFMHVIGKQTGTIEDSYIYYNGRSVS